MHNSRRMKTDHELQSAATAALERESHLDATTIGVAAHGGVVTLTGTACTWSAKHLADQVVHGVDGVLDIANDISICPCGEHVVTDAGIAHLVRFALEAEVPGTSASLKCTVTQGGTVTLTGIADSREQRLEIVRRVLQVPGVRRVNDDLSTMSGPW